jgi:MraZ protein
MALTGTYLRTLDEKKRVAVPKRLKDDFGETDLSCLMIAPGTEKSLVVYSLQGFEAFAAKLVAGGSHQNYLRLFYSTAERVDLDGQGRMRIPDRLADYAGLKREAYLLGVQDHAELWDKDAWDSFVATHTPAFDELAVKAMGG